MKNTIIMGFTLVVVIFSAFFQPTAANPLESLTKEIDSSRVEAPQDLSDVRCFVVSGMILMIPKSTSNQTINDTLNSMLLFQLAADKKYNRNTHMLDWLGFFDNTAGNVCWFIGAHKFGNITITGSTFTVSDLAKQEMSKDETLSKHAATFAKILSIVKSLPKTSNASKLLHNKTYDASSHDTAMTFAALDKDSTSVSVRMLTIGLAGVKDATSNTLIHAYKTKEVKTKLKELNTYELNACYPDIRKTVIDKLGSHIQKDIVEVKLS